MLGKAVSALKKLGCGSLSNYVGVMNERKWSMLINLWS